MSRALDSIKKSRPWIARIDDERPDGGAIFVILVDAYNFANDHGNQMIGFDTVADVRNGTREIDVLAVATPANILNGIDGKSAIAETIAVAAIKREAHH